ncbi:MAG: hypothetical protein ACE5FJ_10430 [Gemmatimonadales bacterium]
MNPILIASLAMATVATQGNADLYRMRMVRAAPGELTQVIELLQRQADELERAGGPRPHMMRHSQGDQWDLLLLYPMESFERYYSADARDRRAALLSATDDRLEDLLAWQEEVFVTGPSTGVVSSKFTEFRFYHVEMMVSLPGLRDELHAERVMENEYSRRVGRPLNLIFSRVAGAAWEVITIGFYRDIAHFAEQPDASAEEREAAAVAAGFERRSAIGTYLRSLMSYHHDTLAVRP